MTDRTLIQIAGWITAFAAMFHLLLPLGWGNTLDVLGTDDRATVYELAFGLTLLLGLIAYVSIARADTLLSPPLRTPVLLWISAFWVVRAVSGVALGEGGGLAIGLVCIAVAALYTVPLLRHHRARVGGATGRRIRS